MTKNLWPIAITTVMLGVLTLLLACNGSEEAYTQSVKIATEQVNEIGSLVIIESYRDDELVNSMHFIDGDGDGIIDGKSGPKERDYWPKGWGWFDDLYEDITVGQSSLSVTDGKIKLQNGNIHEFRVGEYQCEQIGSTD